MYRYGLSNCLFAATHDEILKECGCVPFFHTLAWDDYPQICSGKSLLCMNDILINIGSHTSVEDADGVRKPCFSPCEDQTNRMAVTTSVFPNFNTFTHGPEFCVLYRKLVSTCRSYKNATLQERYPNMCQILFRNETQLCKGDNATAAGDEEEEDSLRRLQDHQNSLAADRELVSVLFRYARENLALVNIYIKDPAVTQIKRDQRVPTIWFVANVGGILGLTMGCSLVTVFEIIHHVVVGLYKTGKSVNKCLNDGRKSKMVSNSNRKRSEVNGRDRTAAAAATVEELELEQELATAAGVSAANFDDA